MAWSTYGWPIVHGKYLVKTMNKLFVEAINIAVLSLVLGIRFLVNFFLQTACKISTTKKVI